MDNNEKLEKNSELLDIEKIREYFKNFIDAYITATNKANLPSNREVLEEIIENAKIEAFDLPNTTGTFAVNRKYIGIITKNFMNNSSDRNRFLLLHEFTHFSSGINNELFLDQNALLERLNDEAHGVKGNNVNGINAYYGMVAIDEALAQWTCEELNDAIKERKREIHEFTRGPLESEVRFKSDFSDNDIYSPLEPVVEKFIQALGYIDLRDFATNHLASSKGIIDDIKGRNYEKLCQLGVICKAIYREQGFSSKVTVSKEDVEQAYDLLMKNVDFGENNGGEER